MPVIIFFLSLLVLVVAENGITGAIANELSQIRVDRIEIALQFPYSQVPFLKMPTYDARKYLIDGASEHYYYPYGLGEGNLFFFNEIQLMPALFKLMCLQQIGQPNQGNYVSFQGLKVHLINNAWYNKGIDYMGNFPCDGMSQQAAHAALAKIMDLDFKLVDYTIQNSRCQGAAAQTLQTAKDYLALGEYEFTLDNLKSAWNQASSCQ